MDILLLFCPPSADHLIPAAPSVGSHPTSSCKNSPKLLRFKITVSDELRLVSNICQAFVILCNVWKAGGMLNHHTYYHCHCKAVMRYFRVLEDRVNAVLCCLSVPKLSLFKPPDKYFWPWWCPPSLRATHAAMATRQFRSYILFRAYI